MREFVVVGIACEDRAGRFVDLRDHIRRHPASIYSENPLRVAGDRDPALSFRLISQPNKRNPYRSIHRDESQQSLMNAVTGMFKRCISLSMPDEVRFGLSDRQGSRRPDLPSV